MPKDPFLLVSLKDDQAKTLSQVLSSATARKILDYLAGKDATETQIAKDLGIALSTVHYNLKQLVAAKLVVADEFHYSSRGKEVNHYTLANKYIIIAPAQEKEGFLNRLKGLLPATLVAGGVALVLQFLARTQASATQFEMPEAAPMAFQMVADESAGEMAKTAAIEAGDAAAGIAAESTADMLTMNAPAPGPAVAETLHWWQMPSIEWFLAGAVVVLLVIVLWELTTWWRNKER